MANTDRALGHSAPRQSTAGSQPRGDTSWICERTAVVRVSLLLDQVATAQSVAGMRRAFAAWLTLDVAAGDLVDDVVLVVYEALANVADHAYADDPDGDGAVRLCAHRAQESLRVTVSDDGRWRAGTDAPFRNRGLAVMGRLIEQLHVETTGSGTTVHLRCALPVPTSAP